MTDGRDVESYDVLRPDDPLRPDPPDDPRERNGVDLTDQELDALASYLDSAVRRRHDGVPDRKGDVFVNDLLRVDDRSIAACCGLTADLGKPMGYWVFACLVEAAGDEWSMVDSELVNNGFHA